MQAKRIRQALIILLVIILNFARLPRAAGQGDDLQRCTVEWEQRCSYAMMLVGIASSLIAVQEWQARVELPEGVGPVRSDSSAVAGCRVTPSTGQGSGVNIRRLPDIDSDIIGDIALGDYRPVSAISTDWYQTETRGGGVGFVAANVTALVGPCGDINRFVVTP